MSERKKFCFRPSQRLRCKSQFDRVFLAGRRLDTKAFIYNFCANGLGFDRLGLAVSRKMGGAVIRNRIKRKTRELFRANHDSDQPSIDIVVRPGSMFLKTSHSDLQDCWILSIEKIKRILKGRESK